MYTTTTRKKTIPLLYNVHLLVLLLLGQALHAQRLSHLDFEVEDKQVVIHYDLQGNGPFGTSLYYSLDGYSWQSVPDSTCKGAIGNSIQAGKGLQLVWQPLKHLGQLEGNLTIKLKVTYTPPPYLPDVVWIQGGSFKMGDNNGEEDEKPAHPVKLDGFWMGKYEITVEQFRHFIDATNYQTDAEKSDGSYFSKGKNWVKRAGINWRHDAQGKLRPSSDDQHPVIHVSWNDATAYCQWLSNQTGYTYRLPTEAEWEYAAQAAMPNTYTGSAYIDEVAWYNANSDKQTHPVGAKKNNAWDLYDMTGNVWEWCNDWYSSSYYSNSATSNPTGPRSGAFHMLRGGSWNDDPQLNRVTFRNYNASDNRNNCVGFRIVLLK